MNMKLGLTLVSLVFASALHADSTAAKDSLDNTLQQIIDNYYKTYSDVEKFTAISASVMIPRGPRNASSDIHTVVAGTMGLPPFNQPITPNSLFEIGSITKSFTAFILLQLQTEGKLSLQDPLGKWLPQYKQWQKVTLRQLLDMTSGIPNYSEDPAFDKAMYADLARVWTNEELLQYAHPEQPLKTKRANLYEYCNSNYILAAMVIEKVTQDTFENQLQKRILAQSNYFKNTFYPAGPDAAAIAKSISSRKIHGYFYDDKTKKVVDTVDNSLTWAGAAGALVANTEDVVHWVQLLYHGTLIKAPYREQALTELESLVSLQTGKPVPRLSAQDPAGFGLGVAARYSKELQHTFWFYEGSTLGFRVIYFWSACNDITTVLALNSKAGEGAANSKIGDHIAYANLNLYKAIIEKYPEMQCRS